MTTLQTVLPLYLIMGIILFAFYEWASNKAGIKATAPAYFYTFGVVLIVVLWPLFMLDSFVGLWRSGDTPSVD